MTTTLSPKGQFVLPAAARRKLKLAPGERLAVEFREGGVFLRPQRRAARYEIKPHPVSGLPRMVAKVPRPRKVSSAAIARLHAELL
jgi:AbrB family looped-hinge helix DNA binding protein